MASAPMTPEQSMMVSYPPGEYTSRYWKNRKERILCPAQNSLLWATTRIPMTRVGNTGIPFPKGMNSLIRIDFLINYSGKRE